jgi:3',5'-cyclic AMP phosphodiesterase CpdA
MFTLAHLTDVHLGPLPPADRWSDYFCKRMVGALSWRWKRGEIHDPAVAAALVADIRAHRPDHIACTGDLANISLSQEFENGARWLAALGGPDRVSFVPGNHDAYVRVPWEQGLRQWSAYMTGDLRLPSLPEPSDISGAFPYVRQRRTVALIGVSSATPQAWHRAGGALGRVQREVLAVTLRILGERGFFRILMIHHPPLPGQAPWRKALKDARALTEILKAEGVELVLHGHNHRLMQERIETHSGPAQVIGLPSASACGARGVPPAAWALHRIERRGGAWSLSTHLRRWDVAGRRFVDQKPETRSQNGVSVGSGQAASAFWFPVSGF